MVWHKVTQAFEADNSLFTQFVAFEDRGGPLQNCDAECKTKTICNLHAGRIENGCHSANPGFPLNRRRDRSIDLSSAGHSEHCEGAGMSSILSGAAQKMQSPDDEALAGELKVALSQPLIGSVKPLLRH
ncbi:hypothetical protein BJ165DRAFT_1524856 [Panaeolus papilionaceus]|nr:hypothetical protein BJ165DRAFT_1524856 [Panaeolus papilionaceus]